MAAVGVADAQTASPYATPGAAQPGGGLITTPPTAVSSSLSDTDAANLRTAISAAKRGDVSGARAAMQSLEDPIARKIAQWTLVDSSAEALAAFADHDVPAGPVVGLDKVHEHPQAMHRESVLEHDVEHLGRVRNPRPPWRFDTTPEVVHSQAAVMGEHTAEILNELGYNNSTIAALSEAGVIVEAESGFAD